MYWHSSVFCILLTESSSMLYKDGQIQVQVKVNDRQSMKDQQTNRKWQQNTGSIKDNFFVVVFLHTKK